MDVFAHSMYSYAMRVQCIELCGGISGGPAAVHVRVAYFVCASCTFVIFDFAKGSAPALSRSGYSCPSSVFRLHSSVSNFASSQLPAHLSPSLDLSLIHI